MKIAVLAVDDMFDSGFTVVLDVFGAANALRANVDDPPAPFDIWPVGVGSSVRTGNGLLLQTTPLAHLDTPFDAVVMAAIGVKTPTQVVETVRDHPVLPCVAEHGRAGAALAAACSGTFFLAESGLLDGLAATTSWWLGPAFRARYPSVTLDVNQTLTHDGQVTTAGAAFAHIDLALAIVARHHPGLADIVARYLLISDRPAQAHFAVPALLACADPVMTAFERWIRDHLAEPTQVGAAAKAIGVSERTLQRTTAAVLGMSPMAFVQEIRLDQATVLLRTTKQSVDAVATAVGYQNAATLRTLIRRRRNSSVADLRRGALPK